MNKFVLKKILLTLKSWDQIKEWDDNEKRYSSQVEQLKKELIKIYATNTKKAIEKNSYQEAYNWLLKKEGINLLNDIVPQKYQELRESVTIDGITYEADDPFTYYNIAAVIEIMQEKGAEIQNRLTEKERFQILTGIIPIEEQSIFTSLKESEIEKLILGILSEIDPSLNWVQKYKRMQQEGKIVDVQDEESEKLEALRQRVKFKKLKPGWKVLIGADEKVLMTKRNGTIKDVASFCHEFGHYIEGESNNKIANNITSEYIAITMELYALKYLQKLGYDEKQLRRLYLDTAYNAISTSQQCKKLLSTMADFSKGKKVNQEEIYEEEKQLQMLMGASLDEEYKQSLLKSDPNFFNTEARIQDHIDNEIGKLIDPKQKYKSEYPYIIGLYLAELTLPKIASSEQFRTQFITWAENSRKINPYKIFKTVSPSRKFINPEEAVPKKKVPKI